MDNQTTSKMDEATKVRAEQALNALKGAAEKVHAREAEEAAKKKPNAS